MNSFDVFTLIEQIAATSSRNAKEDLLRQHIDDQLVKETVRLAYDPFVTFGITPPKPPKPPKAAGELAFDLETAEPWITLHKLKARELTGNAAKAAVDKLFADFNAPAAQVLWRILAKDLRCGISEKTINGVLPNTVPAFDLMLSKPYEEKRIKVFPVAVEPKLDGFRGMSLVTDGVSKAFSRAGNHFPQLDWAGPYLAEMVAKAHDKAYNLFVAGSGPAEHFYRWLGGEDGPSCALDGEMMTSSYAETSGELRRKGNEAKDALLYLFDAVPYAFMRDPTQIEWKVPLRVRRKFLRFVAGHAPEGAPIRLTDFREIDSHEAIIEVYNEHRAAGLEGAMVKPLEGHYVRKKGHIWQKIKAEETEDLRIVGWQTGAPGASLEDKFAGFLVEREHNGEMVEVAVGGGYKHDELAFWDAEVRKLPAGEPWTVNGKVRRRFLTPFRLCEVEFHEVTPDGSLRHPRFVRFRDDKDESLRVAA